MGIMPLFDFKCLECGHQFEALVLKTAASCPKCGSEKLEQLLSLFGVNSEGTRAINARGQKKKAADARRDYAHEVARHEREHHH